MNSLLARFAPIALFFLSTGAATAQITTTTTNVGSSPNPPLAGQSVAFFVQIFGTTTTGTVQMMDGSNNLGAPLTVSCISGPCVISGATLQTSALTVGTHVITAAYSGDGNNAPSSGTVTQVVLGASAVATPSLSTSIAAALSLLVAALGSAALRRAAR